MLPELEKARQAKTIGKSLEAKVTLLGKTPLLTNGKVHQEYLRELINVSQLEILIEGEPDSLTVQVTKAAGQKCERCWHWEKDVGAAAAHPTLCGRCAEAVK